MPRPRAFALASTTLLVALLPPLARAADGPSFDCSRVTSDVNRMVCASPELSALDRQLAARFRATQVQPGVDGDALQRDEARWLRDVRNNCTDAACLTRAYAARDAELAGRGRRAASAPVDDAQPFPVDAGLWEAARSLKGAACRPGDPLVVAAGYEPVPGAVPLVTPGGIVVERRRHGADFAFLLDTRSGHCRVADVVALPAQALAGTLLGCDATPEAASGAPSHGVGLRRAGQRAPLAYWEADVASGQLLRQPLGVSGRAQAIRCQEPATGD